MGCIMRPYFRGGLVSFTNEVGALEGTTVSLNAIYCKSAAFCLEHVFVQKKERDIPSNSFFIMKNTIY